MSTSRPTVLVTGASIAGPAVAFWLQRWGWAPTLLERAPRPREAGQNIDVRGAGREVLRRMGLEEAVRDHGTGEQGTRFVDARGRAIASFRAGPGGNGPTAELEILRGELARLVVGLTEDTAEHVYGDHVTGLAQDAEGVDVTLASGTRRRFDLVVVAEGIRSATRDLLPGLDVAIRDLGMYTAYGTIARTAEDEDWWRWHSALGSRAVTLRPDNLGTTRATLSFMCEPLGYERLDQPAQVEVLRQRFADVGWAAPRVLDGFAGRPDDFYFERIGQVHAPTWARGRVVLAGDAAHAPSPISGMGTTLSFVGAYVLAGELAGHDDHGAGFAAYEERMRPFVDRAQKLPPGTPRAANPRTRLGGLAFRSALRVAQRAAPLGALASRFAPPAREVELPDYDALLDVRGRDTQA